MKNYTMIAFFAFAFFGTIVADTGTKTADLATSLSSIKTDIEAIIPVVSLMMIVLAGLIYGIGQVMGAEIRGRSAVWAQALLIGAILGLLIAAMAQPLVDLFSGASLLGKSS